MKIILEDGQAVEIIDNVGGDAGGEFFSSEKEVSERTLKDALSRVVAFGKQSLALLSDEAGPNSIEIEFGAEAGAEGGFFGLAKAKTSATMTIKLKWER